MTDMHKKAREMQEKEMGILDQADAQETATLKAVHAHHDTLLEALKLLDHLEDQKEKLEAREEVKERTRFSEVLADRIASFGGSWTFIILFVSVLLGWMAVNIMQLINPWDPFPFILLNLVLSTTAALQAPIIMMSQNRQASRDRFRDDIDFERDRLDLKVDTLAAKTIREATVRITKIENDIAEIKAMLRKRTRR